MYSDLMAIIGEGAAHLTPEISEHFCEVTVLPPCESLPLPVASHPDMLMTVIGGELICHADYYARYGDIIRRISDYGGLKIVLSRCKWGGRYPTDCAFNALVTDKAIFCRRESCACEIPDAAQRCGIDTVNVNQGYAGCSSLFVRDCIITADPSIAAAAEGIYEVLSLSPGGIRLDGYDYGFIGGAGGTIESSAYFFGSLSSHPDGDALRDALSGRGISVTELGDELLTDYGGIKIIRRAEKSAAAIDSGGISC